MAAFQTASEVIDLLGGTAETARLTERSPQAVSNWRVTGQFPASLCKFMTEVLEKRGHTVLPQVLGQETHLVA